MSKWIKIGGGAVVVLGAVVVGGVAILASQDFNEYKGLIAEKAKEATGRDLVIEGDLDLQISLTPAIAVDGVRFSNAAWGSQPDMVAVSSFAAEVSLLPLLSGQVVVNRLLLEGVELLAETDPSGRGNWELGSPAAPVEETTSSGGATLPSIDQVVMRDINVVYKDGVSGNEYRLALDEFSAAAGDLDAPVKITGTGTVNENEFNIEGTLGSVAQMANPDAVYPVDISGSAFGVDVSYAGSLGTPGGYLSLDGDLGLGIPSISETVLALSSVVPAVGEASLPGLNALDLRSGVKFDGVNADLTGLALKAGNTDLAGNVSAILGGRPTIEATLTSNLIDVDELLPPSDDADQSTPAAEPADGRVFPADVLPLDALKTADARIAFDGKKVIAAGNEISEVSVRVSLEGGNLVVNPMAATVVGTQIAGNVNLNASTATPRVAANLSASGLDYGELLAAQGITDIATGELDATIDVTGTGQSIRAIMAGLNGSVFVATENGKLDSTALNIVSSDVLSVLPGFNSSDDKTIKCGVVNFAIQDGIANAKAIVFETGGLSAVGIGNADLREEQLNLVIDPRAKQTSLASAAVVPFSIGGTFLAPKIDLDAASLATNAAGTALRGAAAIATGGLSMLLESGVRRAAGSVDNTDYCTPALAGETVTPTSMADNSGAPSESQPSGGEAPAQGPADSIVDGVNEGIRSLFGN